MRSKFIASIYLLLMAIPSMAQINIWEGTSCHKRVLLTSYIPEDPIAAVIVCPGGSYYWHDTLSEGSMVAEWLKANKIAAYVLEYRVAGVADFLSGYRFVLRGNRYPDMISDLLRSISLVRDRFAGPVGVMGFSAGGHLAISAGEFFDFPFLQQYGLSSDSSLRPDFVAAVYPVVTMSNDEIVHKRSRRGLLGENRTGNSVMRDSLSLEKHVSSSMPPVFLLNCMDDPIVDYRNSVVLYDALVDVGVPSLYLKFYSGGHGFGANTQKMNEETATWQAAFLNWLSTII